MTDEMNPETLAAACDLFSSGAELFGSPFYAALHQLMAENVRARGVVWETMSIRDDRPVDDAVPLRFLGGIHRLVLSGALPALAAHYPSVGGDGDDAAAFAALLTVLDPVPVELADALTRPPQTNEVGRSAALVPGLLLIARETQRPLRLREIGSSAGLNLRVDRYRYDQGTLGWGDTASPVRFSNLWSASPPLDEPASIVDRRGCDHDPLDAQDPETQLTLLSYVWPGQDERFALLRAALDVARDNPVPIDRADAADWLDAQLADPAPGTTTVAYHSVVWQYLPDDTRTRVAAIIADAGARATADAPVAWLRLEPAPSGFPAELRVTVWHGGPGSGRERLLATSGFHGGAVEWLHEESAVGSQE